MAKEDFAPRWTALTEGLKEVTAGIKLSYSFHSVSLFNLCFPFCLSLFVSFHHSASVPSSNKTHSHTQSPFLVIPVFFVSLHHICPSSLLLFAGVHLPLLLPFLPCFLPVCLSSDFTLLFSLG